MFLIEHILAYLFPEEFKDRAETAREAKDMRAHLSERQIDKTLEDTFPASDPPAWY